eukprot:gb/GFBE01008051.1/.p1 GENE.gb/GFBE01008051.1/~~gb/GFBE01008051.1/.p1  ORF type:complete len:279 (+),score=67.01 gb/GFBE01008051.1/:1-837(+)
MYEEPTIVDLIKNKSGPELFKELYRHLPLVCYEDYYKNGVWQNDLMRLDIEVIDAHRKEAGAPDVPSLDEIDFPDLPGNNVIKTFPVAPNAAAVTGAAGAAPALPKVAGATPAVAAGTAPAAGPADAAAGGIAAPKAAGAVPPAAAPPLDMKTIALFVSKWKLDPARAKTALEKLTTARRRYVMQNFKTEGAEGASDKLDEYVSQCESTGSWDSEGDAATGVKRPLEQSSEDPNKRQKTDGPVASKAAAAAAKAAAAKAVSVGAQKGVAPVRPGPVGK